MNLKYSAKIRVCKNIRACLCFFILKACKRFCLPALVFHCAYIGDAPCPKDSIRRAFYSGKNGIDRSLRFYEIKINPLLVVELLLVVCSRSFDSCHVTHKMLYNS